MKMDADVTTFFEKPVENFDPGDDWTFGATVPRFRQDYIDEEGSAVSRLAAFASLAGAEKTDAIVIGMWEGEGSSEEIVEALVTYKDRFPDLRALFLGDITSDEYEISWIRQSDLSPLWSAFPKLEHVQIRGATELSLGRLAARALTTLIIESGGLPRRVILEALAAETPELQHFELWIGSEYYGSDSTPDDFADLFAGKLFPKLQTLALRNCEYADDLAVAIAQAPILERISTLDLSMGNLTDVGGKALADSPLVAKLSQLDLHYHFLSDAMMGRLNDRRMKVDVSQQQHEGKKYDGEIYRAIAVSE